MNYANHANKNDDPKEVSTKHVGFFHTAKLTS